MKKKTAKTVKVKVTKISANAQPIWLARDTDGSLFLYASPPTFNKQNGVWACKEMDGRRWESINKYQEPYFNQLLGSLPGPGECWRIEI
jgi:hypothetical protein